MLHRACKISILRIPITDIFMSFKPALVVQPFAAIAASEYVN